LMTKRGAAVAAGGNPLPGVVTGVLFELMACCMQ